MSDFKPHHAWFWTEILEICRNEQVKTVVFTKTIECVDALAPLSTVLLISRDNSRRWHFSSPPWVANDAIVNGFMRQYPNVFRVGMVVDEQDVEEVKADFYIAHHGKFKHLEFTKRISQEDLTRLVGRQHACTPLHRCIGCPTQCMVREARHGNTVACTVNGAGIGAQAA